MTREQWQPIETAPKDGTVILFAVDGRVCAGWYGKDFAPFPWAFVDDTRESLAGCCDHELTGRVYTNGYPLNMPTHWMPLPAPPGEVQQPNPQPSGDVRVLEVIAEMHECADAIAAGEEAPAGAATIKRWAVTLSSSSSLPSDPEKIMVSGAETNESNAGNVQRPTAGNQAEREHV